MDSVRCFVDQSQTDWDKYMPQLASAIRSSVNHMTGMTPNLMMLGREICLPTDLVFRPPKEDKTEDEHVFVTELKENIRKTHEFARKKLQTNQEYMKKDYDLNVRKNEYKPGDFVYILETATRKGRNKKLDPPWKGPGIVVQRITSYVYKLKMENTVIFIYHDRMKRCNDRKVPVWLKRAQNRLNTGENILDSESGNVWCLCRQADNGKFMIQCDLCDEWYHGECVNVTSKLADTWTEYHCPRCQTPQLFKS